MEKEQMLLEALNKFGNFNTVTQEFNKDQLEVIYELMDMVDKQCSCKNLTISHSELISQLENGRDYLMTVQASKITVEDALEAFGFGRNGLGE